MGMDRRRARVTNDRLAGIPSVKLYYFDPPEWLAFYCSIIGGNWRAWIAVSRPNWKSPACRSLRDGGNAADIGVAEVPFRALSRGCPGTREDNF